MALVGGRHRTVGCRATIARSFRDSYHPACQNGDSGLKILQLTRSQGIQERGGLTVQKFCCAKSVTMVKALQGFCYSSKWRNQPRNVCLARYRRDSTDFSEQCITAAISTYDKP